MSIMNKTAAALSFVKNAKKSEIISKKEELLSGNSEWAAEHAQKLTDFGVAELETRTESKVKTDQAREAMVLATNAAADAVVNDQDPLDIDSMFDIEKEINDNREEFLENIANASSLIEQARADLSARIGTASEFNVTIADSYSAIVMVG
jgi:hypothetical protein